MKKELKYIYDNRVNLSVASSRVLSAIGVSSLYIAIVITICDVVVKYILGLGVEFSFSYKGGFFLLSGILLVIPIAYLTWMYLVRKYLQLFDKLMDWLNLEGNKHD